MAELQKELQRLSGTTLDAQGAASVWATGSVGTDLIGALNVKAGITGLELLGVLNRLAGTTGMGQGAVLSAVGNVVDLPGTSGNYASTPDSVGNSVTGDIDIRVKVSADDWTPSASQVILSKYNTAGSNRGYMLWVATDGKLEFWTSVTGATGISHLSTVPTGLTDGSAKWIKVTLDVDNGAAGHDTRFYLSDDGVTWTQLGSTVTTAGTTTINDNAEPVLIGIHEAGAGTNRFAGLVHYAEVRNGIDGTVVAKFDTSGVGVQGTRTPNTVVSSTGETWTINGSAWRWTTA